MRSQWYEFKAKSIALRKQGYSLRMVEKKLGVPKSTLSGWFKNVKLLSSQRAKLLKNWHNALEKARKKAVKWHHSQKENRLQIAREAATKTLESLDIKKKNVIELALAMLYLGEGFKSSPELGIGNSSSAILKFFIKGLGLVYDFDIGQIRCELHLRADQKPLSIQKYWSRELGIPLKNFTTVSIDKRTEGSKTYESYKGVCVLRCGNAAIQRKLLFLAEFFCNKVMLE